MPRIIIDTDPGVDDAIAILMALAAPSVEVAGLTVVGGNVPQARGLRNALALLDYAGRRRIPVCRGSNRPLTGKFPYATHFHGNSGITRRLPELTSRPAAPGAVDFLAAQLAAQPGRITLVALGPLTNLARLERQRPGALSAAAALVVMGGSVDAPGNATPHAEFNFYSDPLAAKEVLDTGVPLTLVDLAACRQVALARAAAFALKSRHPLGRLAVEIVQNWFKVDAGRERLFFYDQLALAVALRPAVMTTRQAALTVATEGPEVGATRTATQDGAVAVTDVVDTQRFFALLSQWLEWDEAQ